MQRRSVVVIVVMVIVGIGGRFGVLVDGDVVRMVWGRTTRRCQCGAGVVIAQVEVGWGWVGRWGFVIIVAVVVSGRRLVGLKLLLATCERCSL